MAWESRLQHGEGKGKTLDEIEDEPYRPPVAVGVFVGTDTKNTPHEAHASFINRLEIQGHSPERARAIAGGCARRYHAKR